MRNKVYLTIYKNEKQFFTTWEECKQFVYKKSNIFYKGFPSKEEALNYLEAYNKNNIQKNIYDIDVYTDGSYNPKTNQGSWAWVAIKKDYILNQNNGIIVEKNQSRNIDGELHAVLQACQWMDMENISGINLYFDYIGIEYWAKKQWKAKNNLSEHYQMNIQKFLSRINFNKVKSHNNNHWNDVVDNLAKKAFSLPISKKI